MPHRHFTQSRKAVGTYTARYKDRHLHLEIPYMKINIKNYDAKEIALNIERELQRAFSENKELLRLAELIRYLPEDAGRDVIGDILPIEVKNPTARNIADAVADWITGRLVFTIGKDALDEAEEYRDDLQYQAMNPPLTTPTIYPQHLHPEVAEAIRNRPARTTTDFIEEQIAIHAARGEKYPKLLMDKVLLSRMVLPEDSRRRLIQANPHLADFLGPDSPKITAESVSHDHKPAPDAINKTESNPQDESAADTVFPLFEDQKGGEQDLRLQELGDLVATLILKIVTGKITNEKKLEEEITRLFQSRDRLVQEYNENLPSFQKEKHIRPKIPALLKNILAKMRNKAFRNALEKLKKEYPQNTIIERKSRRWLAFAVEQLVLLGRFDEDAIQTVITATNKRYGGGTGHAYPEWKADLKEMAKTSAFGPAGSYKPGENLMQVSSAYQLLEYILNKTIATEKQIDDASKRETIHTDTKTIAFDHQFQVTPEIIALAKRLLKRMQGSDHEEFLKRVATINDAFLKESNTHSWLVAIEQLLTYKPLTDLAVQRSIMAAKQYAGYNLSESLAETLPALRHGSHVFFTRWANNLKNFGLNTDLINELTDMYRKRYEEYPTTDSLADDNESGFRHGLPFEWNFRLNKEVLDTITEEYRKKAEKYPSIDSFSDDNESGFRNGLPFKGNFRLDKEVLDKLTEDVHRKKSVKDPSIVSFTDDDTSVFAYALPIRVDPKGPKHYVEGYPAPKTHYGKWLSKAVQALMLKAVTDATIGLGVDSAKSVIKELLPSWVRELYEVYEKAENAKELYDTFTEISEVSEELKELNDIYTKANQGRKR